MHRPPPLALAAAALLYATGCTGTIDAPHSAGGGLPGTGQTGGPGGVGGTPGAPLNCQERTIGSTPLRHLTRTQYARSVEDLLGVSVDPHALPPDDNTQGIEVGTSLSALLVESYGESAARLAAQADLARLLPCKPDAISDACADEFVARFARRAFRRPLQGEHKAGLLAAYAAGKSVAGAQAGVRVVIEAVLQAPSFLYHVEDTQPDAEAGLPKLTAFALANRLSYFIWGSLPDAELLDAAERGDLDGEEGLRAQVTRMLDARPAAASAGFRDFYRQWLHLDQLDDLVRDRSVYPAFREDMGPLLRESLAKQVDHAAFGGGDLVQELLRGDSAFVSAAIAPLFGVTSSAAELTQVELDPAQRSGILTHPGLLAILGKANQSAPVLRGKFVREQLLCQRLTPPPADVATTPPDPAPGLTTRERFAEHAASATCAGCHKLTDPIGFGLEQYDGLGQFRSTEQGKPVDASGELVLAGDATGKFEGALELATHLADSETVRDCVATHYLRFALARTETDQDRCSLQRAQRGFAEGGSDLRSLIMAIVSSDAFRYRKPS